MYKTVAIVGAGPSGIAAAIQLKRMDVEFHLIERCSLGGMLRNARRIENYPGIPGPLSGRALIGKLRRQLRMSGIECTFDEIKSIERIADGFILSSKDFDYQCAFLVVASGTRPVLSIDFESDAGVMDRIVCEWYPLRRLRSGRVMISGAGDAAFDYALHLADQGVESVVVNRGTRVKGLNRLFREASRNGSIDYLEETRLEKVEKTSGGNLRIRVRKKGEAREYLCSHLLLAHGRIPESEFFSEALIEDLERLVQGKKLFFCGDVRNGLYRQAVIAAGDGLKTAMELAFLSQEN